MDVQRKKVGRYIVLSVVDDIGLNSNLSGLYRIFEENVKKGEINIALSFTSTSYLYSNSVGVLIQCYEMLKEKGGKLVLFDPNESIMDIFRMLNIVDKVLIVKSENDLLNA
ncbi:MAG: STAS domain-containing protein [Chitinivibrionales bacterium]|nr:STAS domain-containing protein [Chitinivibrionales bacterium]